MNTSEITHCLLQDPYVRPEFEGVFSCDQLPKNKSIPSAIVANTDPIKSSGQHWIAMYLPANSHPMYFDSYGLPPQQKEFKKFLKTCDYNDIQIQNPFSSTCGQHAIFFLAMACRGHTMKNIQDVFNSKNLEENDLMVTDFVNTNYSVKTDVHDFDFISNQICKAMKDVKINGKHVCPIHM